MFLDGYADLPRNPLAAAVSVFTNHAEAYLSINNLWPYHASNISVAGTVDSIAKRSIVKGKFHILKLCETTQSVYLKLIFAAKGTKPLCTESAEV
jgi:hypothetical protein